MKSRFGNGAKRKWNWLGELFQINGERDQNETNNNGGITTAFKS